MINEYPAELVRVIDGDTLVFSLDLNFGLKKIVEVRLLGVDTAETYGVDHDSVEYETGMKHKRFVEEWLSDADSLRVRVDEKGKYGRWLGEVFNEDKESLNDKLLEKFNINY